MRWLAWIKRAVFLLVVIGLISAASQAAQRWHAETAALTAEAERLRREAASEPDPVLAAALRQDAQRHESAIPGWGNVRWGYAALAGLMYAAGLVPPGWVLHRGLQALSVPCSRRRAVAAQLLGHAGKYIPGKAMVVFLRVGAILPKSSSAVAASSDVGPSSAGEALHAHTTSLDPRGQAPVSTRPIGRVASCVFFETLLMMGVGGAVAGLLLWRSPLPDWVRLIAAAMAIGSLIPLCPPLLRRLLAFIAARRKIKPDQNPAAREETFSPDSITWSLLIQCWGLSLISWALIGGAFALLIASIPSFEPLPAASELAAVATAAISLGMVLGFASLLPGGAGVREYVTLLVLTPVIGSTHALLAVIAARLMFIIVEALMAGLSAAYLRHLHYLQPLGEG
ncbi:lysylphosphatidylglycerol synthase transmembrane domain-containing protein [Allorhodopirellula solitaria]|uniref:Lysylphosphatidylglycerol synthase TM region n=1 Tax=Allorhodopirellula solitaria TaxID=2527987 RepID=A0A5C5XPB9_9BACT|nr:lysylphosphatidylglycerol synthase domain-containing protein [Allorhodopirellula solitaria]TWT64754.1 hypothetical protein CA85_35390 [Allorhodopirellula solitaria]